MTFLLFVFLYFIIFLIGCIFYPKLSIKIDHIINQQAKILCAQNELHNHELEKINIKLNKLNYLGKLYNYKINQVKKDINSLRGELFRGLASHITILMEDNENMTMTTEQKCILTTVAESLGGNSLPLPEAPIWVSSDTNVIQLSPIAGVLESVEAITLSAGTAIITASLLGFEASIEIIVVDPEINSIKIVAGDPILDI